MKTSHKIVKLLIIAALISPVVSVVHAQDSEYYDDTTGAATGVSTVSPTSGTSGAATGLPPSSSSGTFTLQNPLNSKINSVASLVQTFVDVVSYILILFAVLMLVYTGLQYILAQGNSERIKELHKKLLWIVVGVAIVIGARVIIEVVINTLNAAHVINSSTFNQVQNAAQGK